MRQDLLFSLLMLGLVTGSLANPTLPRAVFELHRAADAVSQVQPSSSSGALASWDFGYASMLNAQASFEPVVIDAYIYLPGGLSYSGSTPYFATTQQRYSPKEDSWQSLPSFPGAVPTTFAIAGSPSASSPAIYYFQYDYIWRYDVPSANWSTLSWGSINPLLNPATATSGSSIYLVGGNSLVNPSDFSSFLRYDPSSNSFAHLPSLPVGRLGVLACTVGQRIYAVGGLVEDSNNPSNISTYPFIDWYDIQEGLWSTSTSTAMPFYPGSSVRLRALGVACTSDLVYVFFGMSFVQSYNPTTHQWLVVSSQTPAHDIGVYFGVTTFGQEIFLFGGYSAGNVTSDVVQFIPS